MCSGFRCSTPYFLFDSTSMIFLMRIQTPLDAGHLITFAIKQLKLYAEVIRLIQGVFN